MMSNLIILLFIGAVTSTSLSEYLLDKHKPDSDDVQLNLARRIPWNDKISFRAIDFPCQKAGFYIHPTNCSRFYRCVNYNDKSPQFSIYLFECPKDNKFVPVFDVCIPGKCPDSESQIFGDDPFADIVGGGAAGDFGSISAVGQIVGNQATGDAGVGQGLGDVVGSQGPGAAGGNQGIGDSGNNQGCTGLYQAHDLYCNRYHLCGDTSKVFQCGLGTVFSEENQMCRLKQFNNVLCIGKQVHPEAAFKINVPFDFLNGISPPRMTGHQQQNGIITDPLLSSFHLYNPNVESKPIQEQIYNQRDPVRASPAYGLGQEQIYNQRDPVRASPAYGLGQEQSYNQRDPVRASPPYGLGQETKDSFQNTFLRNFAPSGSLVQNSIPKYGPIRSSYQPSYYSSLPSYMYSSHQPNFYHGSGSVNPYNNFYNPFFSRSFPQRTDYIDTSSEMDDSDENLGFYSLSL